MPEKIQEAKQKTDQIAKPGLMGKDIISTELLTIGEIEIIIYLAQKLKVFRDHQMSTRFFSTAIGMGCFSGDNFHCMHSFRMASAMTGLFPETMSLASVYNNGWNYEMLSGMAGNADLITIYDEAGTQFGDIQIKSLTQFLDLCVQRNLISNRPGLINFKSTVGWPVQALTDLLFLKDYFGSLKALKSKKIAIAWEFNPDNTVSQILPISVVRLLSRFGMDVHLANPAGYELPEDVILNALRSTKTSKGKFRQSRHFKKSLHGADIVYLIPWAINPQTDQNERESIADNGSILVSGDNTQDDHLGFKPEKWTLTPKKLRLTKEGQALVMRWPVRFSELDAEGDVSDIDFPEMKLDMHISKRLHLETYIIASMILANKFSNPSNLLQDMINNDKNL